MYSPESSVRKTGSYIYEEFMPTDGTDVKVFILFTFRSGWWGGGSFPVYFPFLTRLSKSPVNNNNMEKL